MSDVIFSEGEELRSRPSMLPRTPFFVSLAMKYGMAKTEKDANTLLIVFAAGVLFLAGFIFFLTRDTGIPSMSELERQRIESSTRPQ
jgi:hypothetical protein